MKDLVYITVISIILLFSAILFLDYKDFENIFVQSPNQVHDNINGAAIERPSPYDRIKESDIDISDEYVIINIDNAMLARFKDTNSMDPIIDEGSTGIEVIPDSAYDIKVGDIISFNHQDSNKVFIHRVVDIGQDDFGLYYITKGDNLDDPDPDKIRFEQIDRILVGILY